MASVQRRIQSFTSQLITPSDCAAKVTHEKLSDAPIRILVTGAAGQIGYSLINKICNGHMAGSKQKIILHLLDIPQAEEVLQGLVMELEDCRYDLLEGIVATVKPEEAFQNVDIACLVGAMPRKQGMERKDLLLANNKIFTEQGKLLDKYASRNVKVVVVGNPANTNCLICKKNAPSIPAENFSALTRLDQNRAEAQLAMKLKVPSHTVNNVIIWGNHSATQYPDVRFSYVTAFGSKGITTPISATINDDEYLKNDFIKTVQQRGAAVIKARKLSSAMSAAKAIVDHVHDWIYGTPEGIYASMAVVSDGSYGIPQGLFFSFPVICRNGTYQIVSNLPIDSFSQKLLDITTQELLEEKNAVGY